MWLCMSAYLRLNISETNVYTVVSDWEPMGKYPREVASFPIEFLSELDDYGLLRCVSRGQPAIYLRAAIARGRYS